MNNVTATNCLDLNLILNDLLQSAHENITTNIYIHCKTKLQNKRRVSMSKLSSPNFSWKILVIFFNAYTYTPIHIHFLKK